MKDCLVLSKGRVYLRQAIVVFLFVWCILWNFTPAVRAGDLPYATLSVCACGDAGIKAITGDTGHAWLTVTNDTSKPIRFLSYKIESGDTISISIWPDSMGAGGVYLNRDYFYYTGKEIVSFSIPVTKKQLKKIEKATPAESYYRDNFPAAAWHNCASYSVKMWNLAAGKRYEISGKWLTASIPGTLADEIRHMDGYRKEKFKAKKTKYNADIIYVTKDKKLIPQDTLQLSKYRLDLKKGDKGLLIAQFGGSPYKLTKKIKWKTTDSKTAEVKNGIIKAKKNGTCRIYAEYQLLSACCIVNVSGNPEEDPVIKLSSDSLTLVKGKSKTIQAKGKHLPSKILWDTGNKKVAVVWKGKITGTGAGTTFIRAYAGSHVMAFCKVKVINPKISLSKKSITMWKGKTRKLKVTVKGTRSKVSWKSKNPKIVSVKNGKLKAKKAGKTVIIATVNGVKAACKVTVKEKKNKKQAERGIRIPYNAVKYSK